MNDDFERTNSALASSVPGRAVSFLDDRIRSAWRDSSTGAVSRSIGRTLKASPSTMWIRAGSLAVMIASGIQPLLMRAMPATVVPAMPAVVFVVIAMFAGFAAWQPGAIASAWSTSAAARLFRR